MSGAEHTPGPWRAVEEVKGILVYGPVDKDGLRRVVAELPCKPSAAQRSVQQADADLIALSPKLLCSLKTLVAQIEDWEQAVQKIVGKRRYPWTDLEEAKDLIAKAEGR